jgi:hypothetical protein
MAQERTDGYNIDSATVHYSSDGAVLAVCMGRTPLGQEAERKIGEGRGQQIEILVGQSISELATSFYKALERYRR